MFIYVFGKISTQVVLWWNKGDFVPKSSTFLFSLITVRMLTFKKGINGNICSIEMMIYRCRPLPIVVATGHAASHDDVQIMYSILSLHQHANDMIM